MSPHDTEPRSCMQRVHLTAEVVSLPTADEIAQGIEVAEQLNTAQSR
jgi:hypothetical protein